MKTINNIYDSIPRKIILEIYKSTNTVYASRIFKRLGVGQHIKTISFLKAQRIIESHKNGSRNNIKLTQKGNKLAEHFSGIEKILQENGQQIMHKM